MLCTNCDQELPDYAKFCLNCGTRFQPKAKNVLAIAAIILSAMGIAGQLVFTSINQYILQRNIDYFLLSLYNLFVNISYLFVVTGVIFAFVALYRRKTLLSYIAGLIPCGILVLWYSFRAIEYFIQLIMTISIRG